MPKLPVCWVKRKSIGSAVRVWLQRLKFQPRDRPHFDISDDGIITFASPAALDRQGNNVTRLRNLHPSLRALSSDLTEALGGGNIPHWYLRERAEAYGAIVDQDLESVNFSLLYVEGVRLANAERAAIGEKELPPLAQPIREAIDTLLQVHGSFILATAEGVEAIAAGRALPTNSTRGNRIPEGCSRLRTDFAE